MTPAQSIGFRTLITKLNLEDLIEGLVRCYDGLNLPSPVGRRLNFSN